MKIRPVSDLHLEFGEIYLTSAGEDILIIAGDIDVNLDGMEFLKELAVTLEVPVLVLAGNHEFYRNKDNNDHTWEGTIDALRKAAHHTDKIVKGELTFFEDSSAVYDGVRFIGSTLWTDMKLYGDDPIVPYLIEQSLSDYEVIYKVNGKVITAWDTKVRHGVSRQYITEELAKPFDGPTLVVTHHAPSAKSIATKYRGDKSSAAYASRLEDLMLDYEPALWIHGHCHDSFDYEIGKTRVVCNPRGYVGLGTLNRQFDPNLIINLKRDN